jgi:hypothetical protein
MRHHTEFYTYHNNGPNRGASDRTKRNLSKNRNSEKREWPLVVAVHSAEYIENFMTQRILIKSHQSQAEVSCAKDHS